jgi:hypothetical protein
MPRLHRVSASFLALSLLSLPAAAQELVSADESSPVAENSVAPLLISSVAPADLQDAAAPPPKAFEYSEGYHTRAKIHKISSFATLPLFASEVIVGQKLYNDPTNGPNTAHAALAASIATLFAVNSVTGVWNLMEARQDPNHSGRRWVHGLLMLGADVGFATTAALGPSIEEGRPPEGSKSTHRAVAFTAMGLGTAGYLVMLFGGH